MKLQAKLISGFLGMAIITLGISLLAYSQVMKLGQALYEIGVVRLPSIQGLTMMREAMAALESPEIRLPPPGSPELQVAIEVERQKRAWEQFDQGRAIYAPLAQTKEERTKWDVFVPAASAWRTHHKTVVSQIIEARKSGNQVLLDDGHERARAATTMRYQEAAALLADLTALNFEVAEAAKQRSVASHQDMEVARKLLLASAVSGVVGAVGLGILLGRWFSRPVVQVANALSRVARGDLSTRVETRSRDEIGQMVQAMNCMVDALRASEERLRMVSDNLPEGMVYQVVCENDGTIRFHYVSAGVERLHGVSREAVLADSSLVFGQILEEDRPVAAAAQEASLRSMQVFSVVVRLRRADGEIRWRHVRAAPRQLADDRIAWEGMEIDITDRKRADDRVAESENRFRAISEASPLGIFLTDTEGRCLYSNQPYQRITGLSFDEALGEGWKASIHPEDRERVEQAWGAVAQSGEIFQCVQRSLHKDGRVVWHSAKAAPIRDEQGRFTGYVGTLEDITERKRAEEEVRLLFEETERARRALLSILEDQKESEEALRKSEESLRLALSAARMGTWEWEIATNQINWSDMVEPIFGLAKGAFARSFDAYVRLIHPDDRAAVLRTIDAALYDGSIEYCVEHRVEWPDGSTHWMEGKGCVYRDDSGWPMRMAGTIVNITARRRADERRRELEEQLRQIQKLDALGTMAGGIAHDFNNILAAIISFTELARMDNPGNGELQESLGEVLKACKRATHLVRQILSFSRQQKPERSTIQIALVIKEALRLLRSTLPTTIEIKQDFKSGLPDVKADPTQIHQVMMNLGTNAAHAMRGKQGRLTVELAPYRPNEARPQPHQELRARDYVRLKVSDTGHGMDPATLQRIFEPFFTTKGPGEGTGLGLAVVHGIIRDHEGVISVVSQPGLGTTLIIDLPAATAPSAPTSQPLAEPPRGRGERILFVDDEAALREAMHRILTRLGYQPVVFGSSDEAWKALQSEPDRFAAMVTDLTMPGMTGLELAERLRSLRPTTPVILTSGFSGELTEESVRSLGIRALIHKPIDHQALAAALDQALRTPDPRSGAR